MKKRQMPSEFVLPAEDYRLPSEIVMPAPEVAQPAPECATAAAEEHFAPPEFGAVAVKKAAATEEEKRRRRNNRLRNLLHETVMPVAATIMTVAVVFASLRYDPLGNDFLRSGEKRRAEPKVTTVVKPDDNPTNTPTPTVAATSTPTPKLVAGTEGSISGAVTKVLTMYHVEGANGETFETTLSDSDPMPEVRAWLKTWGGYRQLDEQSRRKEFLGYEFSDDAVVSDDPENPGNQYVAQGTVYAVYREDVDYYAYLDSHGPGYFEEVEGEEFPTMPNTEPDFSGAYAWSGAGTEEYIRITVDGETRYLVLGSVWASMGNELGEVPGATYDRATNTLTLDNCKADVIDTNLMGNSFTIKVVGENQIGKIVLWGAGHSGSAIITGDGELYVNEDSAAAVGLMIYGEWGPAALMVDRNVYVEICGSDAAILISGTTMKKAIYTRGWMVTGGIRGNGDFCEYQTTVIDDNGNYVTVPITLAEISAAEGKDFYDYSVVTPEGEPGWRVQFLPE
ncbi:MAG: hypothetical protein J5645_08220 [Lachnospiraceae bacterium]|nr:hypothetical protein [Lachnospiraceae bacterium]